MEDITKKHDRPDGSVAWSAEVWDWPPAWPSPCSRLPPSAVVSLLAATAGGAALGALAGRRAAGIAGRTSRRSASRSTQARPARRRSGLQSGRQGREGHGKADKVHTKELKADTSEIAPTPSQATKPGAERRLPGELTRAYFRRRPIGLRRPAEGEGESPSFPRVDTCERNRAAVAGGASPATNHAPKAAKRQGAGPQLHEAPVFELAGDSVTGRRAMPRPTRTDSAPIAPFEPTVRIAGVSRVRREVRRPWPVSPNPTPAGAMCAGRARRE